MSTGQLLEFAGAYRANGSLVTVGSDHYASRVLFPVSRFLRDWCCGAAVTARRLVVGPDPDVLSIPQTQRYFESNESKELHPGSGFLGQFTAKL
jgi:hypothetical protein